jgi:3',5'-cyclic AMP phosphodiesterase CpdA
MRTTGTALKEGPAFIELVNTMADPPDLMLHGGDIIDDALRTTLDSAQAQVDAWNTAIAGNAIPIRHCCGNHDIWAWGRTDIDPGDPLYGVNFFLYHFEPGESLPHYTFDLAGWRVAILNSNHPPLPKSYLEYSGMLDPAQFVWLRDLLVATPDSTPVLIVSHFPIVSAAVFQVSASSFDGTEARLEIRDNAVHVDVKQLISLFQQHAGKIKLCLSGHVHLLDHLWYNGATFLCSGAVCGKWWGGIHILTPPGYSLIDLFEDGTFEHRYVVAPGENHTWQVPPVPTGVALR